MIPTDFVPKLLTALTFLSNIGLLMLLGYFFAYSLFFRKIRKYKKFSELTVIRFLSKNARIFAFIVALTATLGSLFYSEILGYEPCKLCWYQRILMYPQVILFAIGIIKDDRKNLPNYSSGLSVTGAIIATYHYYLQRGGNPLVPCSTVGYSVSCTQRFSMEYGYITIPVMSLTAFVMIIILMWLYKRDMITSKKV